MTKSRGWDQGLKFSVLLRRKFHEVCVIILVLFVFASDESFARLVKRNVTDEEGNRYIGQMEGRVKQGFGRYEMSDGTVYEGEFKGDLPHGEGTISYDDGSSYYTGQFENGLPHGHGTYSFENGDLYIGSFKKGEINGIGEYIYESFGRTYKGGFVDGNRHGFGTLTEANGSQYIGGFYNDFKEGFALEIDENLTEYRGFYRNGLKHGDGVAKTTHENLYFQTWNTGALEFDARIFEIEHCRLTVDGEKWMYLGDECIDGLAHGDGRAVALDGSAYISYGKFVLGNHVAGISVSLRLPSESE